MTEEWGSISSSRVSAFDVSRASFAVVRKGFDPREVRSYLEMLSHELEQFELREADLRRAVAAAQEEARHPVLNEEELVAALGQQSTQVLRKAHEEATSLLEKAQQQANELLQSAQMRASEGVVAAEQRATARVSEAEASAESLEAQAIDHAQQIMAQAKADGETLVARAREQGRAMLEQAQEARGRVLSDMNAKRRMMHVQIEQLRAARDELARSIVGVRETIDRLTHEISASDEAARAAAQEVARRQPTPEELVEDPSGLLEAPSTEASADVIDVVEAVDTIEAPEAQVVEELFAKIRASARSEGEHATPERSTQGPPVGPDSAAISARDAALSSPRSTLNRKIKRVLQDEQNRLLEAVRHAKSAEDVEGTLHDQAAKLASAAVDPLGDAAAAGKGYAHDHGAPKGPGLARGAVVEIAEYLAGQIAGTVQRKVDEALASDDPTAGINAAFREWRGARLDRVVGDAALEAFSAAIVACVGSGSIRWVASSSTNPCPDCADNELEGPVGAGSTFPTGQPYPPAHAGCHCGILPVIP
jgi:peptidoglycan DL-endopeptidase RipA